MATKEDQLRFVPSAIDGSPSVSEVTLFPDRVELLSEDRFKRLWIEIGPDDQNPTPGVVIRFLDIARWYRVGSCFYRLIARFGWGVKGLAQNRRPA